MGALTLDRVLFDPADTADSSNVGAYLRAGSDGDLLSSTNVGGKEGLDVNVINASITTSNTANYAEDSAHADADVGTFVLAVRNDNFATSLTSADGDYSPIAVDEKGRVFVVADLDVTNSAEKVEDTAAANADVLAAIAVVRQDTLSSSVSADGDYGWAKMNSVGALWTAPVGTVADDAADTQNPVKVGSRAFGGGVLSAVSATGDRADLLSDLYRRVYINDAPSIAVQSTKVTVGATAVALPTTALAGRTRMIIQNISSNKVWIGPSGVTTSGSTIGLELGKGNSLSLEAGQNVTYYAIAAGAGNDVAVFEQA